MLDQPRPENLPPDWRAVRFDETEYWDRKFLDEYGVDKMYGVYVVDLSSVTYCCSPVKNYAMFFVESTYDGGPGCEEDARRDVLEDEIRTADSNSPLVSYMHCSSVDAHIKDEKNVDKFELFGDDWKDDPDEGLQEILDAYHECPSW